MQTKTLTAPISITDGETGQVQAIFSVFNMVDSDGDVVLPSFFTDGQTIPMAAWGHDWGALTPAKGTVRVTAEHALFDGQFNLKTQTGRDHYETVKFNGDAQEWSFGFKVLESEPGEFGGKAVRFLKRGEIFEASPVLVGANRQTYTQAIKSADEDDALEAQKATWDSSYVSDLPDSAFAVILPGGKKDDTGKTTPRSLRKLPHHDKGGSVDLPHLRNALSRLPQTGGLSDAQKSKAQAHLNRHAKAEGIGEASHDHHDAKYGGMMGEPPEGSYEALSEDIEEAIVAQMVPADQYGGAYVVATYPTHAVCCVYVQDGSETYYDVPYVLGPDGETVILGTPTEVELELTFTPKGVGLGYSLHAARVEQTVRDLIERTKAGSALRAKEGRAISEARRARVAAIRDGLRSNADELHALYEETAPREPAKDVDADQVFADLLAIDARLIGVAV